jgi:lysozyme family protein
MTETEIVDEVIEREGGYVDNPADRGGPTKYGITLATLAAWRGASVDADDVAALSVTEARAIYANRYIRVPGFNLLTDPTLRAVVVDAGVHSGPARAVRWLQEALRVPVDGILGPVTVHAANATDGRRTAIRLCCARVRFLGRLVTDDPKQSVFAAGWLARVATIVEDIA